MVKLRSKIKEILVIDSEEEDIEGKKYNVRTVMLEDGRIEKRYYDAKDVFFKKEFVKGAVMEVLKKDEGCKGENRVKVLEYVMELCRTLNYLDRYTVLEVVDNLLSNYKGIITQDLVNNISCAV